ncbi:MAG: hypothetical protein IPK19_16715 [Chloroflexi bacterium]|nr:hypothetical protein [Chloroflexota bacterium]
MATSGDHHRSQYRAAGDLPFGWPSIGADGAVLGGGYRWRWSPATFYQIAEWAMFNYSRERRISGELFDSQVELERSLARSARALSDRLQETNVALDVWA